MQIIESSGTVQTLAPHAQHHYSEPIAFGGAGSPLRLVLDDMENVLQQEQISVYAEEGQLMFNYPNDTPTALPVIAHPGTASTWQLLVVDRPKTEVNGLTTRSIWVIGDVDTGGGI